MQVVRAARFGGPEVLEVGDAPGQVAAPGSVVVDVAVADTLFLDIVIRRGAPGPWSVKPPYVPGFGVAGRVATVGSGVDPGWVGRPVVARPGPSVLDADPNAKTVAESAAGFSPTGGYAEQAVVAESGLFLVPDELDLYQAAALINDGLTAMQITEVAAVRSGERVLVMPAAGGMGSLLVQICLEAGAQVVAAAGGQRKLDAIEKYGAAGTVDYSLERWTDLVQDLTGGNGPDVVLDGVGGSIGRAAFDIATRGGRFFGFGSPSGAFTEIDPAEARRREVTVVGLMDLPFRPEDARRLPEKALSQAAEGRIRPLVGQTFPLAQAAAAHAAIEAREVIGKTLLTI